ncbi:hypothetical protein N0V93_005881 [Gnomoniopsis smithogilvyi]|uniref:FAD-binding domain-containing protein n=1 Tax=Gnomoniopsis smithogilvyi TaxID=1191159 RepID=A0A9W9CYK0_9PEZI|nr:hypothetical protein N0V93_005881 [Gnomoniopsis smithogilvyi]
MSNEHQSTGLTAMIIGAGCSGLLLAQALKKSDILCTVFEQDARIDARPRDWDFGIYWAQSPLANVLPSDLLAQVPDAQVDNHVPDDTDYIPIYNGATAARMSTIPAPQTLRLGRRRFVEVIGKGVNIVYGKRLSRIETSTTTPYVTAFFTDGTQHTAHLLIGCEGAHSLTREFLLGAEVAALQPSPVVASVAITRLPVACVEAFLTLHYRSTITIHPEGMFLWLGVHNSRDKQGLEEWEFMFILSWTQESSPIHLTGDQILDDMHRRGDVFAEPFRSLLHSIPAGTKAWHNRLSSWMPVPWDNRGGRVTLAGDAAHAMTFHRGQGLNNAITDAASLQEKLSASKAPITRERLTTAIAAYEAELVPRGQTAVEINNVNTVATHSWSTVLESPIMKFGSRPDAVVGGGRSTGS